MFLQDQKHKIETISCQLKNVNSPAVKATFAGSTGRRGRCEGPGWDGVVRDASSRGDGQGQGGEEEGRAGKAAQGGDGEEKTKNRGEKEG